MEKGTFKAAVFDVVKCVIFSLLFSMVLVLILALISKAAALSDKSVVYINQAIKVVSLLAGVFLGLKSRRGGLVLGAIVGLLYTVFSFLIFALISRELSFENITVFDFLIGIVAGILSGWLTVNVKTLRKKSA
jgi:putative membrane protein (TIGR04086 family)